MIIEQDWRFKARYRRVNNADPCVSITSYVGNIGFSSPDAAQTPGLCQPGHADNQLSVGEGANMEHRPIGEFSVKLSINHEATTSVRHP